MKATSRQFLYGFLLGIGSLAVVVGGFSLSTAEGGLLPGDTVTPTATLTLTASPTVTATVTVTATGSATPTGTPTATITPPAACPPPIGWVPVIVQSGQTLESIAAQYNTTVEALMQANCLSSTTPPALGSVVYVPPAATPTRIPCGAPSGWVIGVVEPGDTLYHIATLYRITVAQLKTANCLTTDIIFAGQQLYVPNVPTSTPAFATATPTSPSLDTPTPTTPVMDTPTTAPSDTPTLVPTGTPTPVPTEPPTAAPTS